MQIDTPKIQRPFGVTLAILASTLIYAIVPLLQVGMILLVAGRFSNRNPSTILPDGQELQEFASGGNVFGDISNERLVLQGVLAFIFLIIAFFTWRGKPPFIRFIFMGAVVILTALTLVLTVLPALNRGGRGMSGGSLDSITLPILCLQFGLSVLVPLYVVWYLNRAPARAFFRGEPSHEASGAGDDADV